MISCRHLQTKKGKKMDFDYKGFMQDFMIADRFGEAAVRDTYRRAFKEWKNDVEYYASFVMTLNHRLWMWYERKNDRMAKLYDELWRKADEYGCGHFKGEDAEYYFRFLD